jgi:ABC-type transporter Mla subunit MlaD
MRSFLAVPILALAIVAAGCGGGGGGSSSTGTGSESAATPAEDWANSVCQAFVDWNDSIQAAGQGISQNPSEEGVRTAGEDIQSATDKLVEDLRGLGRPDTASGQQAKDDIDQLATSLDTSLQKITDAMDNASGTSGTVNAASTIASTLVGMGQEVSAAFSKLEDIDAQGELEDAFTSADSCAGLTTTS